MLELRRTVPENDLCRKDATQDLLGFVEASHRMVSQNVACPRGLTLRVSFSMISTGIRSSDVTASIWRWRAIGAGCSATLNERFRTEKGIPVLLCCQAPCSHIRIDPDPDIKES